MRLHGRVSIGREVVWAHPPIFGDWRSLRLRANVQRCGVSTNQRLALYHGGGLLRNFLFHFMSLKGGGTMIVGFFLSLNSGFKTLRGGDVLKWSID